MNTKCLLLTVGIGLATTPFYARQSDEGTYEAANRVGLSAALLAHGSEPGYGLTLNYTRFLHRNIGIAGSIGFQQWLIDDYKPNWEVTDHYGNVYHRDDDDKDLMNLNVQIGPVFRLPFLTFGRDKDTTIAWECHPAVAFTFPNMKFSYLREQQHNGQWVQQEVRVNNHGGQWNYWKLGNTISLQNDVINLSLGYAFSNQHPFSCVKDFRFDGKPISASVPSKKITHEVRAAIGFYF